VQFGRSGATGNIYCQNNGGPASPTITDCRISRSSNYGIDISHSSPNVLNSRITENATGIRANGLAPILDHNAIAGNSLYGVQNISTTDTIDARNNCWGDPTGPFHPITNSDGKGNQVSDRVKYNPWLATCAVSSGASGGELSLPVESALYQNYPNPFNPSTTVRYAISHSGFVVIEVYNVAGQRIGVLFDGEQKAGHHEVRFDGSRLASGVYLCRMRADEFTQTRKLLLIR